MGAFFALIIGMSGVSFFNIGAPLWAIIGSLFVSIVVEKDHFVWKVKEEKALGAKVETCLNSCIKLKGTWMIIEIQEKNTE